MKKKFFLIILLTFSFVQITNADCSECKIKEAPAEFLQKYIEDQRIVVERLSKSSKWKDEKYTIDDIKWFFLQYINPTMDFQSYFVNYHFLLFETLSVVSPEIIRDKKLIEKELIFLQNVFVKNLKNWTLWNTIDSESLCSWIPNCSLSGTVLEVLIQITNNNTRILLLYERSILWENIEKPDLILVYDYFYANLIETYNKATSMNCSTCEWWFYDVAWKRISDVSKKFKDVWNATKYWIDAWNLLTWNVKHDELKKLEKDLLIKELARQWFTKEQAKIIIENLEKYENSWWYALENNFIVNSLKAWWDFIVKTIDNYKNIILWIGDKTISSDEEWQSNVNLLTEEFVKNDWTDTIYKSLQTVYVELNKEAWAQTIVDENAIINLIKTHSSLTKIIENLNATVSKSQDVCKRQCQWVWNCDNY